MSLFTLEMSRDEILAGLWSIVSGVAYRKLVRPHLCTHAERDALAAAKDTVKQWPLRVYEDGGMDLTQIVAYSQRDVRQYGTQFVCRRLRAERLHAEGKDERARVSAVSRGLTKMAKAERCSLMLLSQLRKVPHEQYKNPPTVADFRETSQLENDAHCIVLLHRGWDDAGCHPSNDATLIVPKNRHGSHPAHCARGSTRRASPLRLHSRIPFAPRHRHPTRRAGNRASRAGSVRGIPSHHPDASDATTRL